MYYEAVKEFGYKNQRGGDEQAKPGELIDILSRKDASNLLKCGLVREREMRQELTRSPANALVKLPIDKPVSSIASLSGGGSRHTTGAFRVLKPFEWKDQRGGKIYVKPGELVDVLGRHDVDHLLAMGLIGMRENSSAQGVMYGDPANPYKQTKRVGIWLVTSPNYSGGRIHMYQYAWTLADLGAEVWMITNTQPKWAQDYPPQPNLHIVIEGKDKIPPDLDLIVTDSKGGIGKKAYVWKQKHPRIPFVCFNFETPNWVAKYVEDYAKRLESPRDTFNKADFLIANSELSKEHLAEWVERDIPCGVLNPAVNTFALDGSECIKTRMPSRPYAVYSARCASYKGGSSVIKAIWDMKEPFDLVVFGRVPHPPKDTHMHKFYAMDAKTDAEKFALMKNAVMVLAPSKFEGYGMVPGEALASGTPCVVYELPVLRQAYGDDLTYVPWGDEKELIATVTSMARSPKQEVSGEVQKRIIEDKGMPAMHDKVEALRYHAMKKKSVSAHMICYWGFVPESIESIYPYVDELIVAYGPTVLNKNVPDDGSLERIKAFPDPEGKIRIEARTSWQDKKQMRQWCTNQLSGNYHLLLDADEIWTGLDKWIECGIAFSCPRWLNLWHGADHWVYDTAKLAGRRWGKKLEPHGSVCPHYRWSWWRSSYYWQKHPSLVDMNDKVLHCIHKIAGNTVPEAIIYHLGHSMPEKIMQAKHEFYRKRDGDDSGRKKREQVWHSWDGETGDCGDGIIEKVDWEVPDIVLRGLKNMAGIKI